MANKRRDAEYSLPPPEFIEPAREFRTDPEPEYTPLPPEYGQRTAEQPPEKKKRGLRKLLAAPAILLLSFVLTTYSSSGKTGGNNKPSTVGDDLPHGSVVLDVIDHYTGIEGDTLNYRYMLYNSADEENSLSNLPWPSTVTARVTDEDGNTVESPENPDVWTMGRSLDEHAIDVSGLRGDLLLRLRAEYEQDGEQRGARGGGGFRMPHGENHSTPVRPRASIGDSNLRTPRKFPRKSVAAERRLW